ncbi:MAG TPA: zf-HC2 domain-containing protein [Streptosporangiaceae bacterium]|jgi:hypothetical protein|nr:zf-HC2 domain-containing protein [Streptosporangiaceae bacterium]
MSGDIPCSQARQELGVYLLGAIGPAQRVAVARHLASCRDCRTELAGLAGLPALLRRVPADELRRLLLDDAVSLVPGPPLSVLLTRVARARRRRRYLTVAVAVVAAIAVISGWLGLRPLARPAVSVPPWWAVTVESVNLVTRAGAYVRYAPESWGTELQVRVTGIAVGTRCQLWVTGPSGQHEDAGGWIVEPGQQAMWHPASVPFAASVLRSFQVRTNDKVLVTVNANHDRGG